MKCLINLPLPLAEGPAIAGILDHLVHVHVYIYYTIMDDTGLYILFMAIAIMFAVCLLIFLDSEEEKSVEAPLQGLNHLVSAITVKFRTY